MHVRPKAYVLLEMTSSPFRGPYRLRFAASHFPTGFRADVMMLFISSGGGRGRARRRRADKRVGQTEFLPKLRHKNPNLSAHTRSVSKTAQVCRLSSISQWPGLGPRRCQSALCLWIGAHVSLLIMVGTTWLPPVAHR